MGYSVINLCEDGQWIPLSKLPTTLVVYKSLKAGYSKLGVRAKAKVSTRSGRSGLSNINRLPQTIKGAIFHCDFQFDSAFAVHDHVLQKFFMCPEDGVAFSQNAVVCCLDLYSPLLLNVCLGIY